MFGVSIFYLFVLFAVIVAEHADHLPELVEGLVHARADHAGGPGELLGRRVGLRRKLAQVLGEVGGEHHQAAVRGEHRDELPAGRHCFEFRHPSWHCPEIFSLRARHGAAYCVMSGAELPCVLRATADFAYVRMHGPDHHHLYAGSYSDADLSWWADRLREWDHAGLDAFVYFNNDGDANAVRNARTLQGLLG